MHPCRVSPYITGASGAPSARTPLANAADNSTARRRNDARLPCNAKSVPVYGRHTPVVQAAEIASIRGGTYLWAARGLSPHDNAPRDAHAQALDFQASRLSRAADRIGTPKEKTPEVFRPQGFCVSSLAVTYSGMPERHTTIGAERFHFRVRNGIGWFPLAMAARQTVKGS